MKLQLCVNHCSLSPSHRWKSWLTLGLTDACGWALSSSSKPSTPQAKPLSSPPAPLCCSHTGPATPHSLSWTLTQMISISTASGKNKTNFPAASQVLCAEIASCHACRRCHSFHQACPEQSLGRVSDALTRKIHPGPAAQVPFAAPSCAHNRERQHKVWWPCLASSWLSQFLHCLINSFSQTWVGALCHELRQRSVCWNSKWTSGMFSSSLFFYFFPFLFFLPCNSFSCI